MLTTLEQINQKLPQASEAVLQEILTILSAKSQQLAPSVFNAEDSDLANEFAQWEAASDEDSQWIDKLLTQEQI
jgi:hypothetical protein